MSFKNLINKKFIRFLNSKNVLKINFFYHKILGEKDLGNIGFDFSKKPSRKYIVQDIIKRNKYKSYLEIGCFDNELFDHIVCEKKVGVDPSTGGTVRKTSDDFFQENQEKFDCIFIDGLHEYSQVKKDIKNAINFLNSGGVILLHDCLPNNYYAQAIPRCQYNWNGDVWKAIVECRIQENLDTYTCNADNGIGVILNRKNRNLLNIAIKDFSKIKFNQYFINYKKFMNLIEYEELTKVI